MQSWCASLVLYSRNESPSPNVGDKWPGSRLSANIRAARTQQVLVTPKMRTRLPHLSSFQTKASPPRSEPGPLRETHTSKERPYRSHHPHSTKLPVPKKALVTPRVCTGCHGYDMLGSSTRALFAATSGAWLRALVSRKDLPCNIACTQEKQYSHSHKPA